ncbi:MAG: hypothetical protein FJX75_04930 [Armatimonadetes bacterium]|nr:hypothetical protein [Armatimonadota bacterium]
MRSVPPSAMLCIAATAILASAFLVVGCWQGCPADGPWLLATLGAAFLAGWRRVRASKHTTISLGFVVVFWALVHFGPQAALAAAAVSGVAVVLVPLLSRPLSSLAGIYAVSTTTASAGIAGGVYTLAGGVPGAVDLWGMAVPAVAAVATYHLANSAFVALIAGLTSGKPAWHLLREHFGMTGLVYAAGAGLSVLAHLTWQVAGAWPCIAAAPIVYCLYLTLRHMRPAPPAEQT